MVVVWTELARDDLESVFSYIAKSSPYYAQVVKSMFFSQTKCLSQFPDMGRIVPEKGVKGYQEIFVYSYRVIYRVQEETVYIVALLHMRQDMDVGGLGS